MRTAALTALLVLVAPVCEAIVIRHDRDPAVYLRNPADYPTACEVAGGMETLIGPVWFLTAAHVTDGMRWGRG